MSAFAVGVPQTHVSANKLKFEVLVNSLECFKVSCLVCVLKYIAVCKDKSYSQL